MKPTIIAFSVVALIALGVSAGRQPAVGVLTAAGYVLIALAVTIHRRRTNLDLRWSGIAPGSSPAPDEAAGTRSEPAGNPVVPVRFDPPRGLDAALSGVAIDRWPNRRHVGAVMVELAARKKLGISKVAAEGGGTDYRITVLDTDPGEGLSDAARKTLAATSVDGRDGPFLLSGAAKVREALAMAGQRLEVETAPWHRGGRRKASPVWPIVGLVAMVGFFYLSHPVDGTTLGANAWLVVALGGLAALAIWWFAGRLHRVHSPEGTVASEQARGFKQYLETAEAGQLKFEEASEIFSRYLPYAVAFGVTKHWVKVFGEVRELAHDQGFVVADPFLIPMFMIGDGSGTDLFLGDGVGGDGAEGGVFDGFGGDGDGDLFDVDSFTDGLDDFGGFLGDTGGAGDGGGLDGGGFDGDGFGGDFGGGDVGGGGDFGGGFGGGGDFGGGMDF